MIHQETRCWSWKITQFRKSQLKTTNFRTCCSVKIYCYRRHLIQDTGRGSKTVPSSINAVKALTGNLSMIYTVSKSIRSLRWRDFVFLSNRRYLHSEAFSGNLRNNTHCRWSSLSAVLHETHSLVLLTQGKPTNQMREVRTFSFAEPNIWKIQTTSIKIQKVRFLFLLSSCLLRRQSAFLTTCSISYTATCTFSC